MGSRASLNHVYRSIWNQSLGAMVAVAEIAPRQGGGGAPGSGHLQPLPAPQDIIARIGSLALSIALVWGVSVPLVRANPAGAAAIVGSANLATQGNKLIVTTQNGVGLQHSAINWQSFSVPTGNTTHFQQPSAASTVINRVVTNAPSQLFGTLSSNGHLVLVNQAGIAVGPGALVDTSGFTASALRMTEADALAGRLRFGDATVSTAGISVQGRILARSGDAVLIGSSLDVGQDALIQAPNGSTLLAAGQQVEVTGRGLEGISFQLQAPTDQSLSLGKLSGNAVGIFAGTLKHSGQIRADAVTVEGGKVVLKASRQLDVAGQVSAQALNQRGGAIQATAPEVQVRASAVLDASGAAGGGELLVGGGYQGKDARLSNAQTTSVEMGAQLRADATTQGDGGTVIVWADDTTRVHGSVSARGGPQGGNGGFIETSGKRLLDVAQAADASAPRGKGGTWLLDPYDVTIIDSIGSLDGSGTTFEPFESASTIGNSVINAALNEGTAVTISTGSAGTGRGDITVDAPITKISGPATTLTLTADRNIHINKNITSSAGPLGLILQTGGRTEFDLISPVTIDLAGGSLVSDMASGGNGQFRLKSGLVTIDNAFVQVIHLDMYGGTLGGSADVSVINSFTQTDGVINKTGSLSINQASGNLVLGNITAGAVNLMTASGDIVQAAGKALVARGGSVSMNSAGSATLEGLIDTRGTLVNNSDSTNGGNFSVISGGNVLLNRVDTSGGVAYPGYKGGDAGTVMVRVAGNVSVTGNSAYLWAKGGDAATPSKRGGGGAIELIAGQSGPFAPTTTGGNVTLSYADIDATGQNSAPVSITASEGNSSPSPSGSGSVILTASGITASNIAVSAANDLAITGGSFIANSGSIVLRAGWVAGEGGGAASTQGGSLALAGSITAPTVSVSAAGNLSQSSALVITSPSTSLMAIGGDITLANPGNDFNGRVTATATKYNGSGGAVTLRDSNSLELAGVTADSLTLVTAGDVTQAGAAYPGIVVSGAITASATGGNVTLTHNQNGLNTVAATATADALGYGGSVALVNANAPLELGAITATGLNVTAGGNVTQTAALNVSGSAIFAATSPAGYGGNILLDNGANNFGSVQASATPGSSNFGQVRLTAQGPLQLLGIMGYGGLVVSAGGNITQIGSIGAGGAISLTATGGDITLNHSYNYFDNTGVVAAAAVPVNGVGGAVTLAANSALKLGNVTANSLTVMAEGSITQSGPITASGASAFTATGGDIMLAQPSNDFGGVSATATASGVNGGSVNLVDVNSLNLSGVTAGRDVSVTAQNNLVLTGKVSAPRGNGGGTVRLTATTGAITKTRLATDLDVEGKSIHLTASTGIGTSDLPIKVWEDSGSGQTTSLHFANTTSKGVFISSDHDLHVDEGSNPGGFITLSSNTDLEINGALTASGLINLSAVGEMVVNADQSSSTASMAVTANKFTLNSGTWRQVSESLPAFNVTHFRIAGGTFIRALGGDGASGTPYRLTDVYGLQGVGSAYMLDKSYVLANNIDASGTSLWNAGAGFVPIGYTPTPYDGGSSILNITATPFTGSFHGGSRTISNLVINQPTSNFLGLFSAVSSGSVVRNIGLIGANVQGKAVVGGLVGYNAGTVTQSYAEAGSVSGGSVDNNIFGGLVGFNGGTVSSSYATAAVTVGPGAVAGAGLVGLNRDGIITNSFASGAVINGAGLTNEGAVTNSYWDTQKSGQPTGLSGSGLTTAEMKQLASFANWNTAITNTGGDGAVWRIYEGKTYPLLRSFLTPLTVTANDAVKTYNGNPYTGGNGVIYSVPSPTMSGTLAYGGTSQNAVNVGSYAITPTGQYSDQQGYDIRVVGGVLTVNTAALNIIGLTGTRAYDGTNVVNNSIFTLSGLVGSEQLTLTGEGTVDNKNVGNNKPVALGSLALGNGVGENAGLAVNYTLVGGTRLASITPKAITAAIIAQSRVYDGTSAATIAARTLTGTIEGDVVSASGGTAAFADKNAGLYKVVTATGLSLAGADAGNYSVNSTANTTADIAKLAISGSIVAANKTYDAGTAASISSRSLSGVLAGDTASYTGGSASFADKNAGLAKTVTATGLSLAGADADNYSVNSTASTTADIAKLAISGSIVVANKTYDGGTVASISSRSLSGVLEGDTVSYTGGTASFADKNAGLAKTVTATGLTLAGADSGNYTVSAASLTAQADIMPKAITAAFTPNSRIYDGTTTATIANRTLTGAIAGDEISASGGTATFADKNAGLAKTVTATGLSLAGADAGNYTVSVASLTAQADITRKPITAAFTANSRIYDGTTTATIVNRTLTGAIAGDEISASGGTATFADKNAGLAKTVTATGLTLAGADAGNYTVSAASLTAQADIMPKAITAAFTANSRIYDGTTAATIANRTLTGAIAGDDISASGGTATFADKNAGLAKTVTATSLSLAGADAGNYTVSAASLTAQADITPASLALTGVTALSRVYNATTVATVDTSAASLTGAIAGDAVSVSGALATGTFSDKNVGQAKPVAITGLSLSGADQANYTLITTAVASNAAITPAPLTVTAIQARNKVYDGTTAATLDAASASFSGLFPGDVVSANGGSATFADKNAGLGKTVTAAGLTLDGADAGNYTVSAASLSTQADITRKPITAAFTANSRIYDGTTAATIANRTLTGAIAGDDISASGGTATFADKNAGLAKTVTATGLTLAGADAGNYTVSVASLTTRADITPRPLSTWAGGATGAWSDPANWDALPDAANVLSVSIPAGVSVSYDAGSGATQLQSISSGGGLSINGGRLAVAGSLSLGEYSQTSGSLTGGGALTVSNSFSQIGGSIILGGTADLTQVSGNLVVGALSAASIRLTSVAGTISQSGGLVTAGLLSTQSFGATLLSDAGNQVAAFTANSGGNVTFTNTGALDLQGLIANQGSIAVNNTGSISTSGAVAAPNGAIALTANSPLTIGEAGLLALGDIKLTATDRTSAGNLTLNGNIVSTGGSVTMLAANDLVQNSAVSAALTVTGSAGLAGAAATIGFGASATSDAKSVSYLLNGLNMTAPPQLIKPVVVVTTPANLVISFLDVFEQALSESVAVGAPAPVFKSSVSDGKPAAKVTAADAEATGEKTTELTQEKAKEKEKEKEKEKTEVVLGGNTCTPG